ncbi:unnamed protein product [Adineta steineri]|uniref:Uncharacterized protein n=1 Tax=Adineta steineri TaxID=433720 RepID=A0A815GEA5_9BILA|nr:unnamed protein product [Adineta steineri]CAF3673549.1 unnamed protein product [Adineta steineri]
MLAHSPKDRSRSPHRTNGTTVTHTNPSSSRKHSSNQNDTSSQNDTSNNDVNTHNNNNNNSNKTKKENDSQLRMKSLKSFIQTLINDSSSLGSTSSDEQEKAIENACKKEFRDLSHDRIRRMIRSIFKGRKSHQSSSSHTTNSFLHQDHSTNLPTTTTTDRFNSTETNTKKSRSNSTSNNATSDLATSSASTLPGFDADFLRHAFSQQFRPSLDLSTYFTAAAAATSPNGTGSASSLFRPNFSPSNFLQSLTAPPPPLPTSLVSSHTHTNGTNDSATTTTTSTTTNNNKLSKQMKLSNTETSSIKVLVNAYREAASYLTRSADELEQLI